MTSCCLRVSDRSGHLCLILGFSFLLLLPAAARGFSLMGPDTAGDGAIGTAGTLQAYNQEFRWTISTIQYSFDTSFAEAYGTEGMDAVRSAFLTWDLAFGRVDGPTSAEIFTNSPLYDLQSVALHEIGHALGLGHPDEGATLKKNYDAAGNPIPSTGSEVMNSTILAGEISRELTKDDLAGLNYIYDPRNVNMLDGAGVGDLDFKEVAGLAAFGVDKGANIDIFAVSGDNPIFGAGTEDLAIAYVNFIYVPPGDGPGLINGVPQLIPVVGGVDIYFNTSAALGILPLSVAGGGIKPLPTPEPASLLLIGTGLAGLYHGRRRSRPTS